MLFQVSEIKVSGRLRQEMGDIDGLAASIKEHGLLHPIVVTEEPDGGYTLIAGGRRLEAHKRLGITEIQASLLENLSANQRRRIELEENIRRKDLTEIEKSRDLVELAEVAKGVLKEEPKAVINAPFASAKKLPNELSTKTVDNSNEFRAKPARNLGGRPEIPGSIRSVSKELGIPAKTIHDAQQHVRAVDAYPTLEPLPKVVAISAAKELNKIPDEESRKERELEILRQAKSRVEANYRLATKIDKVVHGIVEESFTDDEIELYLTEYRDPIERHLEAIDIGVNTLTTIRKQIESFRGIRRVK